MNITAIQINSLTTDAEEAEIEWFYEDLHDLLELTPKKDGCPFHHRERKNIGSQEIPGVTGKFGLIIQNEAGQRLTEFCQETTLVVANTFCQQHKRCLCMNIMKCQYQNQIDYICCYCSVIQLCPVLCRLMDYSMPGFSVLHYVWNLLRFVSIQLVMQSNHFILCCTLFFFWPSIFPSISVFSSESALCIR